MDLRDRKQRSAGAGPLWRSAAREGWAPAVPGGIPLSARRRVVGTAGMSDVLPFACMSPARSAARSHPPMGLFGFEQESDSNLLTFVHTQRNMGQGEMTCPSGRPSLGGQRAAGP